MKTRLNSRSGMIYTSFALLASSVILMMTFIAVGGPADVDDSTAIRINEASFFLESMLDDLDRTLEMSTRRALGLATDYVVSTGQPLNQPRNNLSAAMVNGTLDDSTADNFSMENASLKAWNSRIEGVGDRAGYELSTEFISYSFNTTDLIFESNYTVFSRLEDPVTSASFNETHTSEVDVSIDGIEDPMITLRSNEDYISNYDVCSFSEPAEKFSEANDHSTDTFSGKAVVEPANPGSIDDPDEKILVVQDVDGYMSDENDFRGVVSAESNSSELSNNNYALDTGSISSIANNTSMLISNGSVWRNDFRDMFKTGTRSGCYVPDSEGPSFIDRLQNELSSDPSESGIATLVNLELLPEAEVGRSVVGYVYFDESADPSTCKLRGVTDDYPWFRLDQEHVNDWGISELAYECS